MLRSALLTFAFLLSPAMPASAATPRNQEATASAAHVLARTVRAAEWQMANAEDATGLTFPRDSSNKRGWVQAPFWIAVERLGEETGDKRFFEAVDRIGTYNRWMPGEHTFHADDYAVIQAYAASYRRDPQFAKIAPSLTQMLTVMKVAPKDPLVFDTTKSQPDGGGFACQTRWCWCDALFMAPASWIGVGNAVGDPRLIAYADSEFWATHDALYSKEYGLFFRDSRFFDMKGEFGEKLFWGRGNGWVFAGLANILRELPADHPSRPRYVQLFKEMAASLHKRQRADGFWATSLAAPLDRATSEASGTAFFVYGMAWGINNGLLDARHYGPLVSKGWRALDGVVSPEGRIGLVQQIGEAPDHVKASDTQFYGSGGFVLAGLEVRKALLAGRIAL